MALQVGRLKACLRGINNPARCSPDIDDIQTDKQSGNNNNKQLDRQPQCTASACINKSGSIIVKTFHKAREVKR